MTRTPSTEPAVGLPGRTTGPTGPTGPAVALRSLRRSYGPIPAVAGLDLDIDAGETVALLGPNGAGKSTTIDMLLGLTRPEAGQVRVFGRDPADAIRAGQVGAMLQTAGMPTDVTVAELLHLVVALHGLPADRATAALHRAGVTELAGRRIGRLSGGQRQRVGFALALAPEPDLLVLDEPTAGMDVESRRAFWQAIRAQTQAGRTVLFATHYLAEADEYADRIVLMRAGRVVADGPATQIKAMAGGRTIRATLPGARPDRLRALPGVRSVEVRGEAVLLTCADSDAALRALLGSEPAARDVEVSGAGLEDAFLALTADVPTGPGEVSR